MPRTSYRAIDVLAGVVLGVCRVRRKLGDMATGARADREVEVLKRKVAKGGSSWAAFQLAVKINPPDLPDLLAAVGAHELPMTKRQRAFDACADAFAVFSDRRASKAN